MKKIFILLFCLLGLWASAQQRINLSGLWTLPDGTPLVLPGSTLTNRLGDDVTIHTRWTGSLYDSSFYFNPYMEKFRRQENLKFPFFLTPEKHFVGTMTYRKQVYIAKSHKGQRVLLYLERPHIETTLYVNGQLAGRDSSLSTPHCFDITPYIIYNKQNQLELKVYNGIEHVCVGQDSHSVTDQTQGNWNGVVGRLELQFRPSTYITDVQVYPHLEPQCLEVSVTRNRPDKSFRPRFLLDGKPVAFTLLNDDGLDAACHIPVPHDLSLWDEFHPNLHTLTTVMGKDTVTTSFGMREISVDGKQILCNGQPIWLRGTVENCTFPLTGYPPTEESDWAEIFRICKSYGLNHMRFHSYCPPEAAFLAADKAGFYLQPEGPSWPNHGVKLKSGMSIDRYLLEETRRMVRTYGNHPSFCMLAAGNEPAGNWVEWCHEFIDYWHSTGDTRRIYCGASVGGGWAWDANSDYHVKGGARGLTWNRQAPQSMDDYSEALAKLDNNAPILSHEQGQWCAFPDLAERALYTGVYKAANFDIFEDLLQTNHMDGLGPDFLASSSQLQRLAYKYEIERNLRTPDYEGFQLLGLNDYSGQGTALVGPLNVFWKTKSGCSEEDMNTLRHACAPVVPLAKFPKLVYTTADTLRVAVELYNASGSELHATPTYTLTTSQDKGSGQFATQTFAMGKNLPIGEIVLPLSVYHTIDETDIPLKVRLQVRVADYTNEWDFHVYPQKLEMPQTGDIYISDSLDAQALRTLQSGGKVLLTAAGKVKYGSDVKQTYLPVFWNTSWFKMRPPHTTGSFIRKDHPVFAHFCTDDWQDTQWWELVNRAQVMNLSEFPAEYQSPFQPIDTWHVSRKLGMIVEANVMAGKLLMTTFDISSRLDERRVARQLRYSILRYMQSPDFAPALTLPVETLQHLFTRQAPPVDMFTKATPDELKPALHNR